jgi:hypothetical protein
MTVAALLCGASGMRAQQAAPADDPFRFGGSDAAIVIFQVKPDKTADFESAWSTIKAKLSSTDKTDWKELGESIKISKVASAMPAGSPAIYVFQIGPSSKTLSYDPGKILYGDPDKKITSLWTPEQRKDVDEIYKKITDSLQPGGLNILPLTKLG